MAWQILGVLFIYLSLACFSVSVHAAEVQICSDIHLTHEIDDELGEGEIKTICGFPEAENTPHQAWTKIPRPQAVLALRAALQTRGYHSPVFTESGDILRVDPAQQSHVTSTRTNGAPEGLKISEKNQFSGELLTPTVLNDLETWAKESLQELGFPCPQVGSGANPKTGEIVLDIEAGSQTSFGPVRTFGSSEQMASNLKRYYAFTPEQKFDRRSLDVSRYRILQSGIVEKTDLSPVCSGEQPAITQTVIEGGDRFFALSLGLNTEEIFRTTLKFRAPRIGSYSSAFETSVFASRQVQQLDIFGQWYFQSESNWWIEPRISVMRRDEDHFEDRVYQLTTRYSKRWDWFNSYDTQVMIGPTFTRYDTQDGPGPDSADELSAQLKAIVQSYTNLVYGQGEREGHYLELALSAAEESVGSDFSALRFDMITSNIWQLGSPDKKTPSDFAFGVRGRLYSIWTPDRNSLPAGTLAYSGGFSELRGFERLSLPVNGRGGLSKASVALELRPSFLMPEGWEPIAFVDAGVIGEESFEFRAPIYWSPGLGLKWYSPIGAVHGFVANGRIHGDLPGGESVDDRTRVQFYLGWGELF